jgi:hypothetical protein
MFIIQASESSHKSLDRQTDRQADSKKEHSSKNRLRGMN